MALVGPDLLGGLAAICWPIRLPCRRVAYAFAGVYGRRFGGISALTAATGQLVAATLLMLPLVIVVDRPWQLASPPGTIWVSLVATAVLCTAAGYRCISACWHSPARPTCCW